MTNSILLEKINNIEVLCDPGMYLTYSAALYFKEGKSIQEVSIPQNEIAKSSGEFVLNNNLKDGHISVVEKIIDDKEELQDFTIVLLKEKYRQLIDLYWEKESSLGKPIYKDKSFSIYKPERKKLHEEILTEFEEKYKHIPSENKVIFSAGLPGTGETTIAKALGTEVKDLMKVNETNEPLEVVFRGELTNRKSKRAFESVLFAIEDYVTMKQVD